MAVTAKLKEEPTYESDPNMDAQNFVARPLPRWQLASQAFRRGGKPFVEIIPLQDFHGQEDQTMVEDPPRSKAA